MNTLRRRIMVLGGGDIEGCVDLGLPSGTLWSVGNLVKDSQGNYSIGAETDNGTYVSWGNIDGHNNGEEYNFSDEYNTTPGKALTADIPSNDSAHDICLARLGAPWRLPKNEDFRELYDNTDSEFVLDYNNTGIPGRKFMKKSDHSVYVFFPFSGYYSNITLTNPDTYCMYWSSLLKNASYAYTFTSDRNTTYLDIDLRRHYGLTIRPICKPNED